MQRGRHKLRGYRPVLCRTLPLALLPPPAHPQGYEGKTVSVFTTRPDTVMGVTYVVLAPEHPYVKEITTKGEVASRNRRSQGRDSC